MINAFGFGKMVVDGVTYSSDLLIHQGTVVPGWRRQSGHRCTIADLAPVLDDPPDFLVLGRGKPGMMRSDEALRIELQRMGITLIEEPTSRAVKRFNRLLEEERRVSAGFHLTC